MTIADRDAGHRGRLLHGMICAVADKGYANVTIADVVAQAGVSKRTFYEHFASKQDCLLACYRDASERLYVLLQESASDDSLTPAQRLRRVLDAWMGTLDSAPELARTVLMEIQIAGADGRRLRRESNLRMAEMLQGAVNSAPGGDVCPLDADQAIALVGGVSELVAVHAEDRPGAPFSDLCPPLLRFVTAVLRG